MAGVHRMGCVVLSGLDMIPSFGIERLYGPPYRAVGRIATHVRPDILHRQQADVEPSRLSPPCPIARGPAAFHHQFCARQQLLEERSNCRRVTRL